MKIPGETFRNKNYEDLTLTIKSMEEAVKTPGYKKGQYLVITSNCGHESDHPYLIDSHTLYKNWIKL